MAVRLKSRFDDHISRKVFHIASGTLIAYLFAYFVPRPWAVGLFALAGGVFAFFELLRLRIPPLNAWLVKNFGFLMREEERQKPTASLYYVLGLGWALFFLPKVV